jgi:pyridoxal phosphate enzyme (YggS family)
MVSACISCGREASTVALLPVTKNHGAAAPRYAAQSGLLGVGENRVQEAASKRAETKSLGLRWELIGHLQSNKAKDAVEVFDRIQSVDSLKLLKRLDLLAEASGKTLPILLQCNAGADPNKYGFLTEEMPRALETALQASHLQVDGLMTIAPLDDAPQIAQAAFESLRATRDSLADAFGVALTELSMGMTGDLEAAIAAGSTQIRVGTALYGART